MFLAATLVALMFLAHCAVVGGGLMRGLSCEPQKGHDAGAWALAAFFAICLGMLVNMLALTALGLVGQLTLPAVGGTAVVLLAARGAAMGSGARRRAGSAQGDGEGAQAKNGGPRAGGRGGQAGDSGTRVGGRGELRKDDSCARVMLPQTAASWAEIAALGVMLLLCVAVSMHPPGHWDDTMYQLPLARYYVEHHAVVLNQYLRFPLFPQHQNMLFALGMLLGDAMQPWLAASAGNASMQPDALWRFGAPEILAQLFATLPLFIMALGLWGASHRYLGSGIPGLIAGLTLFMIGPVKSTLGFAYVDNALALYCWAATLAVALGAERRRVADWALAGLLAGAACGIKYFGVVFATGLGVVVMLMTIMQRRPVSALRAVTAYGVAVVLAGVVWYVRSYLVSGDPAHPAGAPLLGHFLWNEGDLAWQHAEQATYGVGRNPLLLPAALREGGVLLWLPALAGIFIRRLPAGIRVLQTVFVGYLLFWFIVTQVPRYLAPVYAVGGFLSFHALWFAWQGVAGRAQRRRVTGAQPRGVRRREDGGVCHANVPAADGRNPDGALPGRRERRVGLLPVGLVLVACLAYLVDRGSKYGREFLEAETVLATSGGYTLYQQANLNAERFGPRIVQVGFENGIYFFRGTVIGDWFGPGRYRGLLQCDTLPCPLPSTEDLRHTLHEHGARMLLLNRELIVGLNEDALRTAGWAILATDGHGVLLAAPE